MKKDKVLTIEHIRKALETGGGRPPHSSPIPINLYQWEDYKKTFNLTDEQMNKLFVKTTYIKIRGS